MAWAERTYHQCLLKSPEAEPARRYLKQRGVSEESVARWHLGYAPNQWGWIEPLARREGISAQALAGVGVLAKSERGGNHYDRFRGRVLFSIRDASGKPRGLGGRVLPELAEEKTAKYINSPETPLFSKSELLYGLDIAKTEISRRRRVVVVEGYTDCLIAHQAGVTNVVAVLGTALGKEHLTALRFADEIVLVLDGDEAGRRRANEVLELFLSKQVNLRIATLPEGLDPCDYLMQDGAEAFESLLDEAVDPLEHRFALKHDDLKSNDMYKSSRAIDDILSLMARQPALSDGTTRASKIKEAQIFNRIAHETGMDEAMLRGEVALLRRSQRRPRRDDSFETEEAPEPLTRSAGHVFQRELLEVLIFSPDLFDIAWPEIEVILSAPSPLGGVFAACQAIRESGGTPTFDALMLRTHEPAAQSLLVGLDEEGDAKYNGRPRKQLEATVNEIVANLRDLRNRQTRRRHKAELNDKPVSEEDQTLRIQQTIDQTCSRQGISKPTDG